MKWQYGNSWEKYSIEEMELWKDKFTDSKLMVCDIFKELPAWIKSADMIYTDSPWNKGNLTCFYTKSFKTNTHTFEEFADRLFECIKLINPKVVYLEIGKQKLNLFKEKMSKLYSIVQEWEITYYKKHRCYLIRGGNEEINYDYTGLDDTETPLQSIQNENLNCIADLCTGRGLTAMASYKANKIFLGTELNKRRLAVTIDRVNKLGGNYEKYNIY